MVPAYRYNSGEHVREVNGVTRLFVDLRIPPLAFFRRGVQVLTN